MYAVIPVLVLVKLNIQVNPRFYKREVTSYYLIRQCAMSKQMETCGRCPEMNSCEKLGMITGNNADALRRLMMV